MLSPNLTRRLLMAGFALCIVCLAGCPMEYNGKLTQVDEVCDEEDVYWLTFQDGTKWRVYNTTCFWPIGQEVTITARTRGNDPPRVESVEVVPTTLNVEPAPNIYHKD